MIEEKEYEDLVGREFDFVTQDGYNYRAKLIMIDFDLGLTIVNAEDHDDYLLCCYGPTGFKMKYKKEFGPTDKYEEKFNERIKAIKSGYYDEREISGPPDLGFFLGKNPDSSICIFNQ